jgi:hypothetical protein
MCSARRCGNPAVAIKLAALARTMLLSKDEPVYDLGVLFVHGMGQSRQAETLLNFGEPLCQCIERIALPVGPDPVCVSIAEARLDPEPWQEPAQAILRIRGAARDEQNWLLTEAWWAKTPDKRAVKLG